MRSPDHRSSLARPLSLSFALASCTPTHAPPKVEEAVVEAPPPPTPPPAPDVEAPPPPKTQRQARPRSIAVSRSHVCAIEGAGQVACWGRGGSGQLAPGREEHSPTPVRVPGIDDAVAVDVTSELSCALQADHTLTCWGRLGTALTKRRGTMTSRNLGEVVELALGDRVYPVACGRRRDGTVACATLEALKAGPVAPLAGIDDAVGIEIHYGKGYVLRASGALDSFALPDGIKVQTPTPQREDIGDVVDVALVAGELCALLASGQMQCRGYLDAWKPEVPPAGPLWKAKLPGALWASAIDASERAPLHCVRDADEHVWCWGDNDYGQLGTGTPAYTARPRRVFTEPMVAVSAGGERSCGVREGGEVTCFAQTDDEPVEVEGVRMLAVAGFHACAIVGAGEARCWGFSEFGALGAPGEGDGLVRVHGLTDLASIAVAEDHGCAARRDHTLSCWGLGAQGQLGDGRFADDDADSEDVEDEGEKSEPHSATPLVVEGIEGDITGLALGDAFSCAAATAGLHCWGSLPNPSATDAAKIGSPRVVLAGTVTALDGEGESLCALDGEGGLHCWGPVAESYRGGEFVKAKPGRDDRDPTRFSRGGPLWRLGGLPLRPTAVAVGDAHACLLSGTGEVWCWGKNDEGQLGDDSTREREEPVAVRGLPGPAVEIAASAAHTCARVGDGQVLCWGSRTAAKEHGRSSKPVRVVGLTPRPKPADAAAPKP